jgi:fumarylacetoacetase
MSVSNVDNDNWQAANDPKLKSWLESANLPESDFSIQNLPFGIFSDHANPAPRVGVAIGDAILDLAVLAKEGLLAQDAKLFETGSLNAFIATGRAQWRALRARLSALLEANHAGLRDNAAVRQRALVAQTDARLYLPVDIPGYTDFYSSKEHATNVGSMFRDPKNALLPNWLEIPIGYNGRASSVVVSGTPVTRPNGQIKLPDQERPIFSACRKLDIELEMGFIVGAPSSLGDAIPCERAEEHIFGMVLLNDWSARDIQQWEYVPLGPFNSKGFATTISPWIVTLDALEPFRCEQPEQNPQPLSYLRHAGQHGFDIHLEVDLRESHESVPQTISRTNFRHMYWTMAQQLAHHTSGGCNVRVGDLMGSGTISGPTPDSCGSLLESTWNGQRPLQLQSGKTRSFIEDGDELILRGWCQGDGYRVGFGACAGQVLPARETA